MPKSRSNDLRTELFLESNEGAFLWRAGRHLCVQPLEEAFVDRFRSDLCDQVRIADVLTDYLLNRGTIPGLGFDEKNRFRFFHNLSFPAIGARDWKPVSANSQLLLQ